MQNIQTANLSLNGESASNFTTIENFSSSASNLPSIQEQIFSDENLRFNESKISDENSSNFSAQEENSRSFRSSYQSFKRKFSKKWSWGSLNDR